jgi:predicted regulator of Ras-like GTPase activity (Roadblock/LC7/MglB family)
MTSRIGAVLGSALHSPGVIAAVLIDSDGCVIETASLAENDLAPLGVAAGEIVRQWSLVGTDLEMGTLRSLMIERADGLTLVTPVGPDSTLLIVGDQPVRPGLARLDAKRIREAILTEPAVAEPERIAPPPIDHFDDLVRTAEGDVSSPPASLTAGEVVVIGAHTFRLVTKLIAQLLQIRGVRSSRLRAYSPSGTIIDVVLEDGATLATVDRGSLDEFSIEQTEQEGTRLILQARKAFAFSPDAIGRPG